MTISKTKAQQVRRSLSLRKRGMDKAGVFQLTENQAHWVADKCGWPERHAFYYERLIGYLLLCQYLHHGGEWV